MDFKFQARYIKWVLLWGIISIRTFCQIKTIKESLLIGLEGLLEYPDAFKRFQTLESFKRAFVTLAIKSSNIFDLILKFVIK